MNCFLRRPFQRLSHRCLFHSFAPRTPAQTANQQPLLRPTQSQILRFILSKSTHPGLYDGQEQLLDAELGQLFYEDLSQEIKSPPLWRSTRLKTAAPDDQRFLKELKNGVLDIRKLQLFIERNVTGERGARILQADDCRPLKAALQHCQQHNSYAEILSAVNAVITRIERLKTPVSAPLRMLGMLYSCLAFSPPALEQHIKGYCAVSSGQLNEKWSKTLVATLLETLQALVLKQPNFDLHPMRSIVTGEGSSGYRSQFNLRGILYWANPEKSRQPSGLYFALLVELKSEKTLRDDFVKSLKRISPRSLEGIHSLYSCVKALIDVGRSREALEYLHEIAQSAENTLPSISEFRDVNSLLVDENISQVLSELTGPVEYQKLLDMYLLSLESRLGIKWQAETSLHTSLSDPRIIASDNPLLTLDGDCVGLDSTQRLIAEIESLGSSKSVSELGKIADLLEEHDGAQIPVQLLTAHSDDLELSWIPRLCPIEFSDAPSVTGTDVSRPWSARTLGLIRANLNSSHAFVVNERFIHLMQLGYLVARPSASTGLPLERRQQWKETGYIVGWDRVSGQFIILHVGKCYGVVDPGARAPGLPLFGLGSLAAIEIVNRDPGIPRARKPTSIPRSNTNKPRIEPDPGLYLIEW